MHMRCSVSNLLLVLRNGKAAQTHKARVAPRAKFDDQRSLTPHTHTHTHTHIKNPTKARVAIHYTAKGKCHLAKGALAIIPRLCPTCSGRSELEGSEVLNVEIICVAHSRHDKFTRHLRILQQSPPNQAPVSNAGREVKLLRLPVECSHDTPRSLDHICSHRKIGDGDWSCCCGNCCGEEPAHDLRTKCVAQALPHSTSNRAARAPKRGVDCASKRVSNGHQKKDTA